MPAMLLADVLLRATFLACFAAQPAGTAWWDLPAVSHAHLSHDGARLITQSGDGCVMTWDVATGARDECILAESGRYFISGDRRLLLVAADDGEVSIHDAATGDEISRLCDLKLLYRIPEFSPDGGTVIVFEHDAGRVIAFDVRSGARLALLAEHPPEAKDLIELGASR